MQNCEFKGGWDWIPLSEQGQFIELSNVADWQIREGDLVANNQLHSAVIIQLFTDKRVDDDNITDLPLGTVDKGGWWGDYFAPFEIGSLLWTLYRQYLTDDKIADAQRYVRDALQPLINQGACATIEVNVEANKPQGALYINPVLYGKSGEIVYAQQFRRFWDNLEV